MDFLGGDEEDFGVGFAVGDVFGGGDGGEEMVEAGEFDDALDIFDGLMTDIAAKAKSVADKKRLAHLQAYDEAAMNLVVACTPLLDNDVADAASQTGLSSVNRNDSRVVQGPEIGVTNALAD